MARNPYSIGPGIVVDWQGQGWYRRTETFRFTLWEPVGPDFEGFTGDFRDSFRFYFDPFNWVN